MMLFFFFITLTLSPPSGLSVDSMRAALPPASCPCLEGVGGCVLGGVILAGDLRKDSDCLSLARYGYTHVCIDVCRNYL